MRRNTGCAGARSTRSCESRSTAGACAGGSAETEPDGNPIPASASVTASRQTAMRIESMAFLLIEEPGEFVYRSRARACIPEESQLSVVRCQLEPLTTDN